jgi:pimeloyl-ACP methyl ester carboxylesterase
MTAFDLPGHGESGAWDAAQDYQTQCLTVAEALTSGQATDLIGHSFGATVALRLAVEQPHLVRRLVLIEPVFFAAAGAEDQVAFDHYIAQAKPFADAFADGDRVEATRRFNAIWGATPNLDCLNADQRSYMIDRIHLIVATEGALIEDNAGLLSGDRLGRSVTCPMLLLQGDQSPPIIDVIHRSLARRIPQAKRVTILDAGHMSPVTHHRQVGVAINAFLSNAHSA